MSGLSVRTRMEVLKRDRFTCSYCGHHPPDVLLEVDHIVPRAAGGSDDMANLITACADCNRGKADRLLDEGTAPTVSRAVVDDLRERLEQAAAYTELVGAHAGLIEKQLSVIQAAWARAFGATLVEEKDGSYWTFDSYGRFPDESTVRRFLRQLPAQEILAAVDITGSRFSSAGAGACRFFYAICWRRIRGETGPIDQPRPKPPLAPPSEPYHEEDGIDAAQVQLESAYRRIDELEEQLADERAKTESLREERGRPGWHSISDILKGMR